MRSVGLNNLARLAKALDMDLGALLEGFNTFLANPKLHRETHDRCPTDSVTESPLARFINERL